MLLPTATRTAPYPELQSAPVRRSSNQIIKAPSKLPPNITYCFLQYGPRMRPCRFCPPTLISSHVMTCPCNSTVPSCWCPPSRSLDFHRCVGSRSSFPSGLMMRFILQALPFFNRILNCDLCQLPANLTKSAAAHGHIHV
jgi:hypothetical protein